MSDVEWLTKDEAKAAIERCAFDIYDEDDDGETGGPYPEPVRQPVRRLVHCFTGFGCDWSVEHALDAVDHAYTSVIGQLQIGWVNTIWGRCLVLVSTETGEPRQRVFDTVVPEKVST